MTDATETRADRHADLPRPVEHAARFDDEGNVITDEAATDDATQDDA